MQQIHKYTLDAGKPVNVIDMPEGAEILSVGNQGRYCRMWALVNPRARMERREVIVVPTGHDRDEGFNTEAEYIGRMELADGSLIFHVWAPASKVAPEDVVILDDPPQPSKPDTASVSSQESSPNVSADTSTLVKRRPDSPDEEIVEPSTKTPPEGDLKADPIDPPDASGDEEIA